MAIVNDTTSRGYPLPHSTNKLKDDVPRVRASFSAIDADIVALLQSVSLRAMAEHSHEFSDIPGLTEALAGLAALNHVHALDDLSDVSTTGAANGQVLFRQGAQWIPANLGIANIANLGVALDSKADAQAVTTALGGLATAIGETNTAVGLKAPKEAPTFTGSAKTDTPLTIDNSKRIANTEYTRLAIAARAVLHDAAQALTEPEKAQARANIGAVTLQEAGDGTPVGALLDFPRDVTPTGYLKCNGAVFDSAMYPQLFAYLGTNVLPNIADRVKRTFGSSTPAVGQTQEDAFQGHEHSAADSLTGGTSGGGGYNLVGAYFPPTKGVVANALGHGAPRIAAETRGKGFIVSTYIKAYTAAILDPAILNVVALEQAVAQAIRKDTDQNAQALAAGLKLNITKNTLQSWEQIGPPIDLAGLNAFAWTGLADYRSLRIIMGQINPNTVCDVIFQVGIGGSYISTATYAQLFEYNNDSALAAGTGNYSSGTGVLPYPNAVGTEGITFDLFLQEFNKARKTVFAARSLSANGSPGVNYNFQCWGRENSSLAAHDCLRFYINAGLITNGSIILEGRRG